MNDVRKFILPGGEIKSYENDDLMEFSGWMSTDDIDLTKEIVDIGSATKNWDEYKRKGRLWLNHDPSQLLGKVFNPHLEAKGIRADQCRLTDTPFNREYIWPHIKNGALSEFSIQFKSLKGEYDKNKIYHHKEIYLIECSVVSVACNPHAIIDGFKSLIPSEEWYNASLGELRGLYNSGKLKLPSEHRRNFYLDGLKDMEKELNVQETPMALPDFMDITILDEAKGLDQEGEALTMPSKARRDYADVCKSVHLAQSDSRGSFMFRVGVPTAKGFKYEWDSVVMTFGSLLGAKGGCFIQDDEKLKAFDRLFKIYAVLGKQLPKFDGTLMNELSDDALLTLKFSDVEFQEGESDLVSVNVAKTHADALVNSMKTMSAESKDMVFKSVYPCFAMRFDVFPDDIDDIDFLQTLLEAWATYLANDVAEDAAEVGVYMMNFSEFLKTKFAGMSAEDIQNAEIVYLTEEEAEAQAVEENKEEDDKEDDEVSEEKSALIEALRTFCKIS